LVKIIFLENKVVINFDFRNGAKNQIKQNQARVIIYTKGGLIHQNMKDWSYSGVFPGGQTFCSRLQ